jgi:hypothetical protein
MIALKALAALGASKDPFHDWALTLRLLLLP